MEKKVKDEDVFAISAKWVEISSEEVFEIVLLLKSFFLFSNCVDHT